MMNTISKKDVSHFLLKINKLHVLSQSLNWLQTCHKKHACVFLMNQLPAKSELQVFPCNVHQEFFHNGIIDLGTGGSEKMHK